MKAFSILATVAMTLAWSGCSTLPQGMDQSGSLGLPSTGSMAGQIPTAGSLAGQAPMTSAAVGAASKSVTPAAGLGLNLTDNLVQQLGVTPAQATGGAGSLFSTARQGMSPADFAQVSKAVPGMDQYLAAAPSQAAPSLGTAGLMSAAGSALGGSGSALGTAASLAGSFQSLGLNSGMVSQFIPIVLQYVNTTGGSSTMGLLKSALLH